MNKQEELIEHYRKQIEEMCCDLAVSDQTTNYYEFNNDFATVKIKIKTPLTKVTTDEREEWLKGLLIHLDKADVNKDRVIQEAFAGGILSIVDFLTLRRLLKEGYE